MERDIITIVDEFNHEKDMEVILTFFDNSTKNNYILYKDIDSKDECYAAKYTNENNIFKLDTNLTEKELSMLNKILISEVTYEN